MFVCTRHCYGGKTTSATKTSQWTTFWTTHSFAASFRKIQTYLHIYLLDGFPLCSSDTNEECKMQFCRYCISRCNIKLLLLTYTKYDCIFRLKSAVKKSIPDYQSFIYSPTDALVSCLKERVLKFTLKFTLKQLRHISVQLHHHQGAH